MTIHFDPERWESIRAACRAWWTGTLERPLLSLTLHGAAPDRPAPGLENHFVDAAHPFDAPAAAVVDLWDWRLCQERYLGDELGSLEGFMIIVNGVSHAERESMQRWLENYLPVPS